MRLLNAITLNEVKAVKSLSNYNELKNIKVKEVVNIEKIERNKRYNKVYVIGENLPFSGAAITYFPNKRIEGISFYKEGKLENSAYLYASNGQLILRTPYFNDKQHGKGYEYADNGKLRCNNEFNNNIEIFSECYNADGSLFQRYKGISSKKGVLTGHYEGLNKKSFESEVIQDFSKKGITNYIRNGKTTVYERNGSILGELNFNNDSLLGAKAKII